MSKAKRKRSEKEAAKQAVETQTADNFWQGRRVGILITVVFIALILIIIGINHFFSEDQKYYRIDVVTVEDVSIGMDEFIRRCDAAGSDPMAMLSNLSREIIIRKEAQTLGIEVSPESIEQKLMEMAQGQSETITKSEFNEWYRQRLYDTDLSDSEYKDIVVTGILASFFYDAISEVAPTVAEQIHLHLILLDTEEEAEDVKARFEAGESFADLAREASMEALSREEGGDIGWIPRGVYTDSRFDAVAFELEPGKLSDILPYYDSSITDPSSPSYVNYYLLMVSEKAESREINEKYLDAVRANAYDDWLAQKMSEYKITYSGINNGFDSETYSWINWQLQKLTRN